MDGLDGPTTTPTANIISYSSDAGLDMVLGWEGGR